MFKQALQNVFGQIDIKVIKTVIAKKSYGRMDHNLTELKEYSDYAFKKFT
jgi:hypothetical protein